MVAPARVLVADDEPDHAEIARRALAKAGCAVEVVRDGETALRRLLDAKAPHVDLVLADLHMPGKDGAMLARVVRGIPSLAETRIVLASSTDDPEEIRRARASGADAFLPKAGAGSTYTAALAALPGYYVNPLGKGPPPTKGTRGNPREGAGTAER